MSVIYKIDFTQNAARAFEKLDLKLKRQLSKKLDERSHNPRVPGNKLRKAPDCYLVKVRSSGLRAV